jgi:hypothetical protein
MATALRLIPPAQTSERFLKHACNGVLRFADSYPEWRGVKRRNVSGTRSSLTVKPNARLGVRSALARLQITWMAFGALASIGAMTERKGVRPAKG